MGKLGGRKAVVTLALLVLALSCCCSVATFSGYAEIQFNNPAPLNGSKSYTAEELIPMVSLIANKFTKLATGVVDTSAKPTENLIPVAVANYNKFHLKAGQSPLDLSVTFVITHFLNESATDVPNGWDSLMKILDEANNIYPGTVKRIYVEHHGIVSTAKNTDVEAFETYFDSVSFPGHSKYTVGISLPLDYCNSESLPEVLRHVPHISFSAWPDHIKDEPQVVIQDVLGGVKDCKYLLEGYRKDATIRIETGWLCLTPTCGLEHSKNLLKYLRDVNDWAEVTNTSVLLLQAFDVPNKPEEDELFKHTGLWKLVPNANYKHVSEYVFEEKGSFPPTYSFFSWGIIFFLAIAIFIAGLLCVLFFIWYFYPNVYYTKIAPYIPDIKNFRF